MALPLLFLTHLSLVPLACAALVNTTIDDTSASFTWLDESGNSTPWTEVTPSTPCDFCSAQPPTGEINNHTWHDGGEGSVASFVFEGSAVYLYGIDLANPANYSFTLDGVLAGFHYYAGTEQFVFHALLFAAENLAEGANHTLSWTLNKSAKNGTVGLVDYAVVTTETSTSSSPLPSSPASSTSPQSQHKSSKVGPIVGGVIGGLALLAGIGLALAFFSKSRRRSSRESSGPAHLTPFGTDAATSHAPSEPEPSPADVKMLDVAWNNPAPASIPLTMSSPSPSSVAADTDSPSSSDVRSNTGAFVPNERERALETRLAALEAEIMRPPPYLPSVSQREPEAPPAEDEP